jgi:predicted aspartyl protease
MRARLPLLLDTGASNTMILWGDVERLGIDISKMKPDIINKYILNYSYDAWKVYLEK